LIDEGFDGDICSTGFCVLRPQKDKITSKWIFYVLLYDGFYNYIEPLQTGASYPAVTDNIVKDYTLPVPSLSEQQRIVSRLDSAFAHIDERKANAEKQLSEARALFQKALTKAMEPKEGWGEKTLSPSLQDEIQRKTTGAALKQINIKDLRNLQLFVPSLSEQQRIVSRLDSLSANVKKLEEIMQKTIAECDALKQAILLQVFE
jgi:restriction endonuclease S subunit